MKIFDVKNLVVSIDGVKMPSIDGECKEPKPILTLDDIANSNGVYAVVVDISIVAKLLSAMLQSSLTGHESIITIACPPSYYTSMGPVICISAAPIQYTDRWILKFKTGVIK